MNLDLIFNGLLKIGRDNQIMIDPIYLNMDELKKATYQKIQTKDPIGQLCNLWFPVLVGPHSNKYLDMIIDEISDLLHSAGYED